MKRRGNRAPKLLTFWYYRSPVREEHMADGSSQRILAFGSHFDYFLIGTCCLTAIGAGAVSEYG